MSGYNSDIYNMLNKVRHLDESKIKSLLAESESDMETETDNTDIQGSKSGESIPYTNNDELMKTVTETAKAQFGADFTGFTNPMLYYPDDGDVVLSGKVPTLNNLLFQFRFLDADGGGCYIWSSPLSLTADVLSTLNKIHGVFKNWKKELENAEDRKPMSYKNKE